MEKLAEECLLNCHPNLHSKIMEHCLQIVTSSGNDFRKKEVGWLLIARVLENCTQEGLRACQTKLGKRLPDIADAPTLSSAIFVRQLLIRNPSTGDIHATAVEKIILRLIDISIQQNLSDLKEITSEIFAIRYGCSKSDVLLLTLEVILRQKFISGEEKQGLLNITSLGISQYASPLLRFLFKVLSTTLAFSRPEDILDRDKFLTVIEMGLSSTEVRDIALQTLENFFKFARKSALHIVPLVTSMLIAQLKTPSSEIFSVLNEISQQYGPSSLLYKHLYVVFEAILHPLDNQEYGKEAAKLLTSIIRTSGYLIQPEILIVVQQAICKQYCYNPFSKIYHQLMICFLTNTHPLVPPPVQIARSMLNLCPNEAIATLCDLITRPRIMGLDMPKVLEKSVSIKIIEKDDTPLCPAKIKQSEDYQKSVDTLKEAVQRVSKKEEIVRKKSPIIENETKKRQHEEEVVIPIFKKPKNSIEVQTVLREGEESVDEIFDSFVV